MSCGVRMNGRLLRSYTVLGLPEDLPKIMQALEVHAIPPQAKPGHFPWDLQPNSTMTNANLDGLAQSSGRRPPLRAPHRRSRRLTRRPAGALPRSPAHDDQPAEQQVGVTLMILARAPKR